LIMRAGRSGVPAGRGGASSGSDAWVSAATAVVAGESLITNLARRQSRAVAALSDAAGVEGHD
jgi:hypothetical protein